MVVGFDLGTFFFKVEIKCYCFLEGFTRIMVSGFHHV